ncbi:benzoate-CoA ligase family protein [Streptomyces europaeiscabiei]|uniref:Benzoate-CoA ligase family protein n=1 Tax=Streptomyces europaeiscabiei TaxID=146819 RepID=A0ABU4NLM1_9ACTN|nr:benzoate-CoA ligase family protein [Streptomyces europaeiscabiei]MDX3545990.1 benzoate-CoA ligase family protein [Streptomyces europaeiscabiei]MDX3555679.1 benzoate-CoA ligase family protein [Streptomyces europaeiscabiei]MDX3667236.1 benzoate-CoA ligase family protein [Streptomyces europaeiscabiei]MDX3703007.1 benzoate-CoA ligase family protein [Streptomyces europaeiscabiei]MDX3835189.1 benzoate-CoA ligase family protein [Streptomyces europaeiscabiei]
MTITTTSQPFRLRADAGAPGNLAAHLAALAERRGWAGRPAFHQGHRAYSHGEVHDLAARAATVLTDHGVRPGDRVLLALPDSVTWVTTFLALARLGAVAVLVNPELTPPELQFMAEDTEAVLWVTGPGLESHSPARATVPRQGRGTVTHAAPQRGRDQPRTTRTGRTARPAPRLGADQLSALCATTVPMETAHPVDAHTPLYIQYTSGTTGHPKGVVHVHGDPRTYHDLIGRRLLRITPDDVTLSVSRLYFAYGFGNALVFPLFSGSAAVLADRRPTPAAVDELVARHRVTLLYSVPSAYAALVADRAGGHQDCFASVRAAVSAGEGMPAGLGKQVTELLGAPVLEQIGSTEAGHAFCANSFDHNHPGTVGRPVPGFEVELRDRAGAQVADGETGELWVRGPTVTPGYLNRPEESERTLVGGWLNTRDRAVREADGTYRHLGRADDMEMVGGITVSPLEVEALLRTHPGVRDVAVAAVTDERGASRLRAFVIPVPPIGVGLEAELICMARDRLAAFKVPRSVSFVPTLPRTATGKLRRHLVRQGAW